MPCDDCPLQYEPIKDDQLYKVTTPGHLDPDHKVVMTEYVAGGGDGFKIIAENKEKHLQVKIYLAHTSFHHMPSRGPLTLTF